MYAETPRYPRNLVVVPGPGLGSLGEAGCPQQVPTKERDELRDRLNRFTRDYRGQRPWGQHWHEGHPDLERALRDIIDRMVGLTLRPKLLRCNAEARKRARNWIGSVDWLLRRVKSKPGSYSGFTSVPKAFTFNFYRGGYRIRSDAELNKGAPAPAPPVQAAPVTVQEAEEIETTAAPPAALAPAPIVATSGTHIPPVLQSSLSTARGGDRVTTPVFGGQYLPGEDPYDPELVNGEYTRTSAYDPGFGIASSIGLPVDLFGLPTDFVLLGGGLWAATKYIKW